jgi:ABC-2 type transport system ATP-binding protein
VADRVGIMVNGVLRVDCPADHFRESLRKIVIELNEPLRGPIECTGLVSYSSAGTRLEMVVVNYTDEQRDYIESLSPKTVDVLELNLEDAFVEYTRGRKGTLSVFSRENAHA